MTSDTINGDGLNLRGTQTGRIPSGPSDQQVENALKSRPVPRDPGPLESSSLLSFVPGSVFVRISDQGAAAINTIRDGINDWAEKKGWNEYQNLGREVTPNMLPRVQKMYKGEKLMLMVTELAEAQEALRQKDGVAMDDKVPALTGEEAELADALIRIYHYAGEMGIDLGRAVQLKMDFNITRPFRHGKAS